MYIYVRAYIVYIEARIETKLGSSTPANPQVSTGGHANLCVDDQWRRAFVERNPVLYTWGWHGNALDKYLEPRELPVPLSWRTIHPIYTYINI